MQKTSRARRSGALCRGFEQLRSRGVRFLILGIGFSLVGAAVAWAELPVVERQAGDDQRLQTVVTFAENVFERGRDRWSGQDTPLLVDGIDPVSGDPVVWRYDGDEFIIHNLASQQNLFRTLRGLTNLTGEARFEQPAREAFRYHFDHLRAGCGKLRWGGHQFIDLRNLKPIGHFDANCHEFKWNLPFYELMWDVDPQATAQFLRALWQGHILDWETVALNRHARYGSGPPPTPAMWEQPFADPDPFFDSNGLSFLNCGADLVFGGAMLYHLGNEQPALTWAKHLAGMYTKARHPDTGMGAYQFTKPRRRQQPPAEGPLTGNLTYSSYGDRTENKYGHSGSSDPNDEFFNPIKGEVADDGMLVAREGWVWSISGGFPRYTLMQLFLAEAIGQDAMVFAQDAADHLEAHARHAYDAQANHFRPMWADGTDVTGLKNPRTGYGRGSRGDVYSPNGATTEHLAAYLRAARLTQRTLLWQTARDMARGFGLGDIGAQPGDEVELCAETPSVDPELIFAVLELYRMSPQIEVIDTARRLTDRLIEARFHHGFFLASASHRYANFNCEAPLAVLAVEAAVRGEPELVPAHVGSRGFIHGRFDGRGRTTDHSAIWSVRRN